MTADTSKGPGHLDLRDAPRDARGRLLLERPVAATVEESVKEVMAAFKPEQPEGDATAPATFGAQLCAMANVPYTRRNVAIVGVTALLAIAALASILYFTIRLFLPAPSTPGGTQGQTSPYTAPSAAPAPTAAPEPTQEPTAQPIPAFWGPGGETAGSVAPAAIEKATAVFGKTWVAVVVAGGGQVWIPAGQLPEGISAAGLPDLEPSAAPVVIERRVEVPVVQRCESEADIRFRSEVVQVTGDKGEPLGTAQGASCYSQAEAQRNLEAQIADLKARAQ